MSTNGEEQTDIVILVDEEGNEHSFAMVDRFEVDMIEYAVLVPVSYIDDDQDDQDGDEVDFEDEAYIFRIDLEEGEETLVEVEDEIEWNEVAAVWEGRVQSLDYADDDEF